jgi:hypothetical protein
VPVTDIEYPAMRIRPFAGQRRKVTMYTVIGIRDYNVRRGVMTCRNKSDLNF